ncbi:MAG: hypothetical protein AB8B99_01945 [Phormidesmis sp.]
MSTHRTVVLEAHDGSRWRSLSELPTINDSRINQYLLWENPGLTPQPKKAQDFPPIPKDCSDDACSRIKDVAYAVMTCLDLAQFKAGVENVAKKYKEHSQQVMTELRGVIAMAQVLSDGNIPVRFIVMLDH